MVTDGPGGYRKVPKKMFPASGDQLFPTNFSRIFWAQIWAQKWGPKFGVWDLAKIKPGIYPPFGFPTFMGMNRQDPEENPPGGVAKVELRGSRAILSFLAFRAISY